MRAGTADDGSDQVDGDVDERDDDVEDEGPALPVPAPSWGTDLRRRLSRAALITIGATVAWFAAAIGLLDLSSSGDAPPDGVVAALLIAVAAATWALSHADFQREDHGYRVAGLGWIATLSLPVAALLQIAALLLWPMVAVGQNVISGYASDPGSFAVGAGYVAALFSWCTLAMSGFAIRRPLGRRIALLALCVCAVAGAVLGILTLDAPPTTWTLLLWPALAVLGLVLAPLVTALLATNAAAAPDRQR